MSVPTQRRDSYFLSSSTRLSRVCFCGEELQQLFLRTKVLQESEIPNSPGWGLTLPHPSHLHLPPNLTPFVSRGLDACYLTSALKELPPPPTRLSLVSHKSQGERLLKGCRLAGFTPRILFTAYKVGPAVLLAPRGEHSLLLAMSHLLKTQIGSYYTLYKML